MSNVNSNKHSFEISSFSFPSYISYFPKLPSLFSISGNPILCTGGAYYVTYIFRFISNKFWNWGGGGSLNRPIVSWGGGGRRGWLTYLITPRLFWDQMALAAQKSLDFQGPPLPMPLVMMLHASKPLRTAPYKQQVH